MIATNAFSGRPNPPGEAELSAELGASKLLWDRLVGDMVLQHKLTPEWNSYSRKAGWSLRLKSKDRNIVYLSPLHGCFRASFALGDRAVKAALASDLPAAIIKIIKEARRYAEGTAVRIEVQRPEDIEGVRKLVAIKIEF